MSSFSTIHNPLTKTQLQTILSNYGCSESVCSGPVFSTETVNGTKVTWLSGDASNGALDVLCEYLQIPAEYKAFAEMQLVLSRILSSETQFCVDGVYYILGKNQNLAVCIQSPSCSPYEAKRLASALDF